jgi:aspartate/methionine/tyrosine aminotransferase
MTGTIVIGAYTPSQGLKIVREEVAQFIAKRDGFPRYTHVHVQCACQVRDIDTCW